MNAIHVIGYAALALNLTSMTMKNVLYLRWLSLLANIIYLVYGIVLHAPPFIVGCGIAILIHGYHIFKLKKNTTTKLVEVSGESQV
jgi:hypothetical protein